jgi:hypothetical protein
MWPCSLTREDGSQVRLTAGEHDVAEMPGFFGLERGSLALRISSWWMLEADETLFAQSLEICLH